MNQILPVTSLPTSAPVPALTASSLNGRAISTQSVTKLQESLWNKICRFVSELWQKFKQLFTWTSSAPKKIIASAPKEKKPSIETAPIVVPSPTSPPSFLRLNEPAYNLRRLSEMQVADAASSLSTEAVFKAAPRKNAYRLGYDNSSQYQTALGDNAIAMQAGATALGLLGLSLGTFFVIRSGNEYPKLKSCIEAAASIWPETSGKTLIAASGLTMAASLYAHHKGWLGALLHDTSSGWRGRQVEALFEGAANELASLNRTDALEAEKIARQILANSDLIEISLQTDLQLTAKKASMLTEILRTSCHACLEDIAMGGKA